MVNSMAGFCIVLMMMGFFLPIFIFAVIIFFTFLIINLFNYFMESFALYRLSKNSNCSYPIISWIPVYNRIILGKYAEAEVIGRSSFIIKVIYLIILFIFMYFKSSLSFDTSRIFGYILLILSVIYYVLNIILVHFIMKKTIPKWADLLTVLNVFTFGISKAIILFILRNNKKLYIKGD